jgi:hypothetical protein
LKNYAVKHPLPYWGEPLPDEQLGSWLLRMVLLNAITSFAGLAEWLDLGANAKSLVADPWKGAGYIREIAARFGYEHDDLLRATTSRGYRDCFRAQTPTRRTKLGQRSRSNLMACPDCMKSDQERYGAPYFRRAHQLTSLACPMHGLRLLDSCAVCKRPLCAASDPIKLSTTCQCGALHLFTLPREQMSEAWIQLARFTQAALNGRPGDLDTSFLTDFALEHALKHGTGNLRESTAQCLVRAFGAESLAWFHPRAARLHPPAIDTYELTPHLLVALLVSCGIGFAEAKMEVARQRALPPSERRVVDERKPRNVKRIPEGTEEAKKMALACSSRKAHFRDEYPYAYWTLFFSSRKWLIAYYQEGGRRTLAKFDPPPSIKEDRALFTQNLGKQQKDRRARVYVRDRAWLESLQGQRERPNRFEERRKTLVQRLEAARTQHMQSTERPTKWTIKEAARRLSCSDRVLSHQSIVYPKIRELVPEPSAEFYARSLQWAYDELTKDGADPPEYKVLYLANLHKLPEEMTCALFAAIRQEKS